MSVVLLELEQMHSAAEHACKLMKCYPTQTV